MIRQGISQIVKKKQSDNKHENVLSYEEFSNKVISSTLDEGEDGGFKLAKVMGQKPIFSKVNNIRTNEARKGLQKDHKEVQLLLHGPYQSVRVKLILFSVFFPHP